MRLRLDVGAGTTRHPTERHMDSCPELSQGSDASRATAAAQRACVYMTCILNKGQLGVAYYDELHDKVNLQFNVVAPTANSCRPTRTLFVSYLWLYLQISVLQAREHTLGPFAFQMLQLAKLQAAPTLIYTSSKSDQTFLDKLREGSGGHSDTSLFEVRIEKASWFLPEQAMKLLQNLQVAGMPAGLTSDTRLHYINTQMRLSATQQVCAAGALLAILHQAGHLTPHRSEQGTTCAALYVEEVSEVSVDGFLTVDAASMHALQIFQEDKHPSAMGIGSSKEGFSVFGILNSCVSSMGQRLLRLWFLRPIINLQVLSGRQDPIAYFMQSPDIMKTITDALRKTRDVTELLRRLRCTQGLLDTKDFSQVLNSITNLLSLRDIFGSLASTHRQPPPPTSHSSHHCGMSLGHSYNSELHLFGHHVSGDFSQLQHSGAAEPGQLSGPHSPSIIQKVLACIGDELLTCKLQLWQHAPIH